MCEFSYGFSATQLAERGARHGYSYAITAAERRMTKAPAIITGKRPHHVIEGVFELQERGWLG